MAPSQNHCTSWSSTKDECSTPLAEVAKQVSGTTGTASGRAPVAKESIFSYVATANIKRLAKLTADAENRLLLVAAAAELAATSASSRQPEPCHGCGAPVATRMCRYCKSTFYCTAACKKRHLSSHSESCLSTLAAEWEVTCDDELVVCNLNNDLSDAMINVPSSALERRHTELSIAVNVAASELRRRAENVEQRTIKAHEAFASEKHRATTGTLAVIVEEEMPVGVSTGKRATRSSTRARDSRQ